MSDTIRVTAAGESVYYVPEFLARELGFFADEGLDVQTEAPGGTWLAGQLSAGTAEIALGGVWRPLLYRGRLTTFHSFAQLCDRNPQVLIARAPAGSFTWTDLHEKTVILSSGAPSPWIFLRGVLKPAGVDLRRVRFVRDLQSHETTPLFRAGLGDFYLVMPPLAEELAAAGFHVAIRLADAGRVPWSVYYATPELLAEPARRPVRFARAIQRALRWVLANDVAMMIEPLRRYFPKTDPQILARGIASAKASGVWTDTIRIPEDALHRWQAMMVDYGLIERPFPYADVVDVRVADLVDRSQ